MTAEAAARRNRCDVMRLHRLPQACGLLLERYGPRHVVVRSKEPLRSGIANCPCRCCTSARRQTRARRNDGQVARHQACAIQLRPRCWHWPYPASAEMCGVHRRHRAEDVIVMNIVDVGEPRSSMQWTDSAKPVDVHNIDVRDVHHAKPAAVSTPPRMEPVTR